MLSGKLSHSFQFATAHYSSSKVLGTCSQIINSFLTLASSGQHWDNIALSLSCADLASVGPYQEDLGQCSSSTAIALG